MAGMASMANEWQDIASSPPAEPGGRRHVRAWHWALLAFLLAMGLTSWLALVEKRRGERDAHHAFTMEARLISDKIREQLQQCEHLVRAFQSVFLASEHVSPEEYARAYENMRFNDHVRFSLQALAYAERQSGPAGDIYPTVLYAPHAGNEALAGLDAASQPMNLDAILRAGDSNKVAMSAPFPLLQSGGAGPADGLILRLPVYAGGTVPESVEGRRQALAGSVGASFRFLDLIDPVIPKTTQALADVRISDVSEAAPQRLFERHFGERNSEEVHVVELNFGGRRWQVSGHPKYDQEAQGDWVRVLGIGGLISILLAALTWSLAATRERAIVLGTRMGRRYLDSEERFRRLNELLPCLVLLVRKSDGQIVYGNASARERLAFGSRDASLASVLPGAAPEFLDQVGKIGPKGPQAPEVGRDVQLRGANGRLFWASVWVSHIELEGVPLWLLVASDNSEQRQLTERLSYQASHDTLTHLPNRSEFERSVQEQLDRPGERSGAILFIDLDQFKLINDTSGHHAGDTLLAQLAVEMREKLRSVDVLARLGGDEFGVLLPGVADLETALQAAERLRACIEGCLFSWEGRGYPVSASVGVAMLAGAGTLKELFTHADAACYQAKDAGRNRAHAYTEDDAAIHRRMGEMEWANRVQDALREGRLLLDYQELRPLRGDSGTGAHVELLLRLRGEDNGVILPGAFLPAAERYGLMPMIDRWVVETALGNLDRLHPDGTRLATCAINLSAASLENSSLYERIEQLIGMYQLAPQRLLFEITESVAMRDFTASSALIGQLRALGCRVALDDFGVGMSSFAYLKDLQLDMVKIDGSFVQNMGSDQMSRSIVRAIAEIGHQQGLEVVAEWVSSTEMLEILATMNVDYAQGFALHRPERVLFQRDAA